MNFSDHKLTTWIKDDSIDLNIYKYSYIQYCIGECCFIYKYSTFFKVYCLNESPEINRIFAHILSMPELENLFHSMEFESVPEAMMFIEDKILHMDKLILLL